MYYSIVPCSRLVCVLWPGIPVSHIVGILIGPKKAQFVLNIYLRSQFLSSLQHIIFALPISEYSVNFPNGLCKCCKIIVKDM